MSTRLVVGNQKMLVNIDEFGRVVNLYYPHVGQEDHTQDGGHEIGFTTHGAINWLSSGAWKIEQSYENDTLIAQTRATHTQMGVELTLSDFVSPDRTLFVRKVRVRNTGTSLLTGRLVFSQKYNISGVAYGDTAYVEPRTGGVLHYKGQRYFLSNVLSDDRQGFHSATVGKIDSQDRSAKTLEDGQNIPHRYIAHGDADSLGRVAVELAAGEEKTVWYWTCVNTKFQLAAQDNEYVIATSPERMLADARRWSEEYVSRLRNIQDLSATWKHLYTRSALTMYTQTDASGAIIAANHTEYLKYQSDSYSYMWPRDGAFVAHAFDLVGDHATAAAFYRFCFSLQTDAGYLLHKYNPDRSLGSSWHPWMDQAGIPQLPIQEDETALPIWALWNSYQRSKDTALLQELWPQVAKAADFLVSYRYAGEYQATVPDHVRLTPEQELARSQRSKMLHGTNLPKPSYDLWEESWGIHTFTVIATWAGLRAAAEIAKVLGHTQESSTWLQAADEVHHAVCTYMYDAHEGIFARRIHCDYTQLNCTRDMTADASMAALFLFDFLPLTDPRMKRTMGYLDRELWVREGIGGYARYVNDVYCKEKDEKHIGNPWIISTAWFARYAAAVGDMEKYDRLIEWIIARAHDNGLLPEQVEPINGKRRSVRPLTWSHAEYIAALHATAR